MDRETDSRKKTYAQSDGNQKEEQRKLEKRQGQRQRVKEGRQSDIEKENKKSKA